MAGCTSFTPVYGDNAVQPMENGTFRFAEPKSRLDQIVYQDVKLKLGISKASNAPLVGIVTTSDTRDLTKSDVARPNEQHEAVVSAEITITSAAGTVVFHTTRSASAVYTTDTQGLADTQAQQAAEEQAAQELAETVRLTLISSMVLKSS